MVETESSFLSLFSFSLVHARPAIFFELSNSVEILYKNDKGARSTPFPTQAEFSIYRRTLIRTSITRNLHNSNGFQFPVHVRVKSSRRTTLLKYLFFFSRSDFFKKISRTHQIFQERQKVLEHIKISRRAFLRFCKNRYDFPGHTPKNRYFAKLPDRWMLSSSYREFTVLFAEQIYLQVMYNI